jgi:acyl carrier protein
VTEAEVLGELRGIVRDRLRLDVPMEMSSDLRRDLQLDSLKALELVVAIENRFHVTLTPEVEAQLKTVGDIVQLIIREGKA